MKDAANKHFQQQGGLSTAVKNKLVIPEEVALQTASLREQKKRAPAVEWCHEGPPHREDGPAEEITTPQTAFLREQRKREIHLEAAVMTEGIRDAIVVYRPLRFKHSRDLK